MHYVTSHTVFSALASKASNADLVCAACTSIRMIAGNDDVKELVARAGTVDTILSAMTSHILNADVVEQGLVCMFCAHNFFLQWIRFSDLLITAARRLLQCPSATTATPR